MSAKADSVAQIFRDMTAGKITRDQFHTRIRELRWAATGLPWWIRWLVEPFL